MKNLKRKLALMLVCLALSIAPMLSVSAREDAVHLVLWHAKQGAQLDALTALISAFQRLHPSITIEPVYHANGTLQETFTKATPDQSPDVILAAGDNVGLWSGADRIKDLSISIPEELKAQASNTAWGLFQLDDGLYAVPYSAQTMAFFYNKSLVPDAPATWADVLSTARQVHSDHVNVTGLAF